MPPTPVRFSIITVVFNARDLIEGTIQSVLAQTWPQVEYIIVDGASKDGTTEIIRAYGDRISRWVSEPDKGLYDAMSKGLRMATGDFVWFVNAGDRIFAPDTLEQMASLVGLQTDVLYGEVMLVDDARKHLGTRTERTTQKLPKKLHWKSLRRGMVVCHQGFVPRREIAPSFIENNLTADIDWVIRCLQKSRETVHTGLILAEYLEGGISNKRRRQSLRDRYQVLKKHYGFIPNLWNHLIILLRAAFKG